MAWLVGGFALVAWLIVRVGAPVLGKVLEEAGLTGLLAIAGFHLSLVTSLMGLAWWRLRRTGPRWIFVWGRMLRDAGSEILPLSQVGGSVLAARAIILRGIGSTMAAATIIADATMEFCAQIAFVAVGLVTLTSLAGGSTAPVKPILVGIAIALAAAVGFICVQRRGADVLARAAARFLSSSMGPTLAATSAVQTELRGIYQLKRVWPSFALHLAAWILTAVEAWLALRLMGASIGFATVLTLESLLYAARSIAFLVPSAIGIQEGAYVVIGTALGLTPELALGLSVLKRGRDLLLGIPALLSWQIAESRRR
ncbi:MAG TPA: lysylphosphatidylglycerol synthase domain-containing protein [Stellaceae bacterium]|nr:lysylphosphatidylglycerol synthase domain-containing protein [Stellaceae bacterium]